MPGIVSVDHLLKASLGHVPTQPQVNTKQCPNKEAQHHITATPRKQNEQLTEICFEGIRTRVTQSSASLAHSFPVSNRDLTYHSTSYMNLKKYVETIP